MSSRSKYAHTEACRFRRACVAVLSVLIGVVAWTSLPAEAIANCGSNRVGSKWIYGSAFDHIRWETEHDELAVFAKDTRKAHSWDMSERRCFHCKSRPMSERIPSPAPQRTEGRELGLIRSDSQPFWVKRDTPSERLTVEDERFLFAHANDLFRPPRPAL